MSNWSLRILGNETSSSQPILLEGELKYELNCILVSRKNWRWMEYLVSWKENPNSKNSWVPHYDCYNFPDLIQEFYKRRPTTIGHLELILAAMKLLPVHLNFSLSHLLDDIIVPQSKVEVNVTFRAQKALDNQLAFLEAKNPQLGSPYQVSSRAKKTPFD
ncbi:hypothetical protein DSO57_1013029 [Entomophthora muscae]|uniref:Uncharacterized protein n=1 Tax=Entomophthora muscae TaxID=34485 RepID=A0ACC2S7U4_9FUNG|nr:hypothetical protein DSO57_1013029 [Entomophthora muscae]